MTGSVLEVRVQGGSGSLPPSLACQQGLNLKKQDYPGFQDGPAQPGTKPMAPKCNVKVRKDKQVTQGPGVLSSQWGGKQRIPGAGGTSEE